MVDLKNKIAELEKKLYAKDFKSESVGDLLPRGIKSSDPKWDTEKDAVEFIEEQAQISNRNRIMKKFVTFSIILFIGAALIAGFVWFYGLNVVSGEKIGLDIVAPVVIAGGEPFKIKTTIVNNNTVVLANATLLIEYPRGFFMIDSKTGLKTELSRTIKELGELLVGQLIIDESDVVLFGEENINKEVKVILEYKMLGSNATLKKTATQSIKISSSPVTVQLRVPQESTSGQEVVLSALISSNSKNDNQNIIVEALYPPGFDFQSADPPPTYGTNSWKIIKLTPEETKTITIRGTIEGQENEEKVHKILVGEQDSKDEKIVGLIYNTVVDSTIITKSVVALDVLIDNDNKPEHSSLPGANINIDIMWKNNSKIPMTDLVIEAHLKGELLNRYSLYAGQGGFYRSVDNTIIWNKLANPELSMVEPGARGVVSFNFSPVAFSSTTGRLTKNPTISLEATARAQRTSDNDIPEDVTTLVNRKVKFITNTSLVTRGLYASGPFKNSGPLNPQADKKTTYTIAWTARNSSNNVSGVVVKTILPIYVKWLGKVFPEGEDISYNQNTSEVLWKLGRIPYGGTRDAAFQVSFIPSVSQINQAPALTGGTTLIAIDDFTKSEVSDKKPPVTTLLSDPEFDQGRAGVIR